MSMPTHLILIRHGESEGNVARGLERAGDLSLFTDEFVTTPGRRWALTENGLAQAACVGEWLTDTLLSVGTQMPARCYASPYVRTRQTAENLGLTDGGSPVRWWLNRSLRERDWGDIETMPAAEFTSGAQTAANARKKHMDPLYWRPPGGESIVDVAENRVRNFLDTLHREYQDRAVVAVTHGEFMWAARLVLERADDEGYERWDRDARERIVNCHVHHYSRLNPTDGSYESHLAWFRDAFPTQTDGQWRMAVGNWRPITFSEPTPPPTCSDDSGAGAGR